MPEIKKTRWSASVVANDGSLTRARYSDRMKIGEKGWHKDGHLIILVQKTARGFRRIEVLQTREDALGGAGWWRPTRILKGVFKIDDGTLLLTDKRVRKLTRDLGLRGKCQIRKGR